MFHILGFWTRAHEGGRPEPLHCRGNQWWNGLGARASRPSNTLASPRVWGTIRGRLMAAHRWPLVATAGHISGVQKPRYGTDELSAPRAQRPLHRPWCVTDHCFYGCKGRVGKVADLGYTRPRGYLCIHTCRTQCRSGPEPRSGYRRGVGTRTGHPLRRDARPSDQG